MEKQEIVIAAADALAEAEKRGGFNRLSKADKKYYCELMTAVVDTITPMIEAQGLRAAADADERIQSLGQILSGELSAEERKEYVSRQEVDSVEWLRSRAEDIENPG